MLKIYHELHKFIQDMDKYSLEEKELLVDFLKDVTNIIDFELIDKELEQKEVVEFWEDVFKKEKEKNEEG